jgi:hypothetical protein
MQNSTRDNGDIALPQRGCFPTNRKRDLSFSHDDALFGIVMNVRRQRGRVFPTDPVDTHFFSGKRCSKIIG